MKRRPLISGASLSELLASAGGDPDEEPSDGEIEAMTGASITSRAVTNAVNEAITKYNTVKEGA